jgi:hypothetical protein
MKLKIIALALLASTITIGYSTTSIAEEICYSVGGSLTTENITNTLQIGNMTLTLSDENGEIFNETGSLVGNITGGDASIGQSVLSHKARFPQGDSFVTEGDLAQITGLLDFIFVDGVPVPCAFSISEYITDIPKGTRLFKNVTSVNVAAQGAVYNCPSKNENSFELSGVLCVE